jgi:hypothetical protein
MAAFIWKRVEFELQASESVRKLALGFAYCPLQARRSWTPFEWTRMPSPVQEPARPANGVLADAGATDAKFVRKNPASNALTTRDDGWSGHTEKPSFGLHELGPANAATR